MPVITFDIQSFIELVRSVSSRDLTKKTRFYQKPTSMGPLLKYLITHPECQMAELEPLLAKIPVGKQQKYADALKYLRKSKTGLQSKMFHSLNSLADKLSKSQQRFIIPMLASDMEVGEDNAKHAEGGLCQNLTLFWLLEQFQPKASGESAFPRVVDQNIMANKAVYGVTKKAANLRKKAEEAAKSLGMEPESVRYDLKWQSLAGKLTRNLEGYSGIYAQFKLKNKTTGKSVASHAIGVFKGPSNTILFYDSNAGSYRIKQDDVSAFIRNYVEVCLLNKWPHLRPGDSLGWFYVKQSVSN